MATPLRFKKSKLRLPAFLQLSKKESITTTVDNKSQSLSRTNVSTVSTMAVEGDIIFTRRHSSNTDLTTVAKDTVTSSSTPANQRSALVSLNTTTFSTPPNKPERRKRPTSRDLDGEDLHQLSQLTNGVTSVDDARPSTTTSRLSCDGTPLNESCNSPTKHAVRTISSSSSPITMFAGTPTPESCSSPANVDVDTIARPTSSSPETISEVVAPPPRRTKRQAPQPPPGGQTPSTVVKQKTTPAPPVPTQDPPKNDVIDDVTSVSSSLAEKPCRFQAPPPPTTPPPISVSWSTQVYITKRNSLTSDCPSAGDECNSLTSDLSEDVPESIVQDAEHTTVAMLAQTLMSEMKDLTNKTRDDNDDVIEAQPNNCDEDPGLTSSTLTDIESLFDASLDCQDSVTWQPDPRSRTDDVTELGWFTSRAEPEGASSDETRVDSLKKMRKLTACRVLDDDVRLTEPSSMESMLSDDVTNSASRSRTTVVPIRSDTDNSCDDEDSRIVLPPPKRKTEDVKPTQNDTQSDVIVLNTPRNDDQCNSNESVKFEVHDLQAFNVSRDNDSQSRVLSTTDLRQCDSTSGPKVQREPTVIDSDDDGDFHFTFPAPTRRLNVVNNNRLNLEQTNNNERNETSTLLNDDISSFNHETTDEDQVARESLVQCNSENLSASDNENFNSYTTCDVIVSPESVDENRSASVDSFRDVIQQQVESFLDVFNPGTPKTKIVRLKHEISEIERDSTSDDVIDSEIDSKSQLEMFYFGIKASCSTPIGLKVNTRTAEKYAHVENGLSSKILDAAPRVEDNGSTTSSPFPIQRRHQGSSSGSSTDDGDSGVTHSEDHEHSVFCESVDETPYQFSTRDVTAIVGTSSSMGELEHNEESILAPVRNHGDSIVVDSTITLSAKSESDRLTWNESDLDYADDASARLDIYNANNANNATSTTTNTERSDITAYSNSMTSSNIVPAFTPPKNERDSMTSSYKHVSHGDVASSAKLSSVALQRASDDVIKPRVPMRSGLQFVQKPKQVVLVELKTSSDSVEKRSRDVIADTARAARIATSARTINSQEVTSPGGIASPSGGHVRNSKGSTTGSQVDNGDGQEEFSSKLLRLKANLKSSQSRSGNVSMRFTTNGTELVSHREFV